MPDLEAHSVVVQTDNPEQTQQLGEKLGRLIQPGDLICLSGELGAGKTPLAQGIGLGWGTPGPVNSPTFVFVNVYNRGGGDRLFHVDAYRLRSPAEAESIALSDLLNDASGAVLIEWPERVAAALPDERLWVTLEWAGEESRSLNLIALGRRYTGLLKRVFDYDFGD